MKQWFPLLPKWMNAVPDPRLFHKYSMSNILSEGMFLFLSGEASRNAMNNRAEHSPFYKENFSRLFEGMNLAHFDTVNNVLQEINMEDMEQVKVKMIKLMIEKKRISSFYGRYLIAIDATGVTTYDDDPKNELVYKESKKGKKTYLNIMLEAKIVTPEGLCLSIASEPLSNADMKPYEKQDCELKAFKRITDKIKRFFPRLPICLLLDGLYTNNPVFDICQTHEWKYIVTLKDGSLPYLQQSVTDTEETARVRFERLVIKNHKSLPTGQPEYGTASYQCIERLHHKEHSVNWIECICPQAVENKKGEKVPDNRFVYLTNFLLPDNILEKPGVITKIAEAGRLRWKIENEGFNTQKNHGYNLHHKFSGHSVGTQHIYYLLLQIAHIINQLVIHSQGTVALLKRHPKLTIRYLWERLRSQLELLQLSVERLNLNTIRCQIRLE